MLRTTLGSLYFEAVLPARPLATNMWYTHYERTVLTVVLPGSKCTRTALLELESERLCGRANFRPIHCMCSPNGFLNFHCRRRMSHWNHLKATYLKQLNRPSCKESHCDRVNNVIHLDLKYCLLFLSIIYHCPEKQRTAKFKRCCNSRLVIVMHFTPGLPTNITLLVAGSHW